MPMSTVFSIMMGGFGPPPFIPTAFTTIQLLLNHVELMILHVNLFTTA